MFTVQDASTVFTLTDAAADKVKSLIEAEGNPELVLRVAVRPGGCSGLSYEMFFDTDVAADDVRTEHRGVTRGHRPRERPAPRRRVARLQGRPAGRRVLDQQPERDPELRLRPVVLVTLRSLDALGAGRRSRSSSAFISLPPNAPSSRDWITPAPSTPKSHGSLGELPRGDRRRRSVVPVRAL